MTSHRSDELFRLSQELIPGGVNSPARAFKAVGGTPRFIARAQGPMIWDEDGNGYLDYIGSWGPMILGHGHPAIVEAVQRQAALGMSYGAPTELEFRMAQLVCAMVPSVEQVRMVSSGTEATMSAIRVARAATGRELVIKFEGCYHGHGDAFLSKAGSGMATLGEPTSPGVPRGAAACTLNARYNDLSSVQGLVAAHPGEVAAVILEPVVGNMGCVVPTREFLAGLRELCTREGIVLIFDEVMTGFRLAPGGAQELFGIHPDLTTLGKVIGGGLPVGAYGGRPDLMQVVSPAGPMYQAGTLSGNPLAMAAGLAQLEHLNSHRDIFAALDAKGAVLADAVLSRAKERGYPVTVQRVGSMGTVFFTDKQVSSWDEAATCDTKRFGRWFWWLLERGVYLPCAQYEAYFISAAHTSEDVSRTASLMAEGLDAVFA
ncbi:glutamate-1-semialdehyde 2,1-aminomutase [bacterium]|nr:glutamate-1-semialdehyde 2,1-aminomutase [bacterium]